MGKIVVTSFMTMDGIVESPEKWSLPYWNKDIERFKDEELRTADAQLLGRRTYEVFAEAWPSRHGHYADRLNETPKYVVSTSLRLAHWNNSHIITGGDQLDPELRQIKERHAGRLLVHGSHSLVQALVQRDLVDDYHLLSTRWCSARAVACSRKAPRRTWNWSVRHRWAPVSYC